MHPYTLKDEAADHERAPRHHRQVVATRSARTVRSSARYAATVLCAWSHPGRIHSDAAFAMLAGAAPIPASSGQTVRFRLNRSGTDNSTAPCTPSLSADSATTPPPAPTPNADEPTARPTARSAAASSATSPANSSDNSNDHLTTHGCVPKRHHVRWRRDTDPPHVTNLLPVCTMHHGKIHHDDWIIELGPNRELTLRLPDGTIQTTGPPVDDDPPPDPRVGLTDCRTRAQAVTTGAARSAPRSISLWRSAT